MGGWVLSRDKMEARMRFEEGRPGARGTVGVCTETELDRPWANGRRILTAVWRLQKVPPCRVGQMVPLRVNPKGACAWLKGWAFRCCGNCSVIREKRASFRFEGQDRGSGRWSGERARKVYAERPQMSEEKCLKKW